MKEKRLFIFIIVFGYICVFLHAQATCHITDSVAQHNESIKFISGGLEYQIMPDDSLWAEVSSPAKDLTDYQYPKTLVIPAEINYKGQIYKVHTICNLKKSIDIDTLVISEGILRIREHTYSNITTFYIEISRHNLSQAEFHLCLLTRLGFDSSEISILMDISKSNLANVKKRANQKIFNTNSASRFKENILGMSKIKA